MNYYLVWYFIIALSIVWPLPDILIPLLGTPISLDIQGEKDSPVLLYNMHDDENTSAMAGRIISSKYGGEYY